jgi:O-antigen/teichoic acid export membrane protein
VAALSPEPARHRSTPAQLFVHAATSRAGFAVLSTLAVAVAARAVPVGAFGVYAAALGYAMLLSTFLDLGNDNLLVRTAAAQGPARATAVFLRVRLLLTAATLLAGVAFAFALFAPADRPTALVALSIVALSAHAALLPLGQVHADVRPYRTALLTQAAASLAALLAVLFVLDARSSEALAAAAGAGAACATAYGVVWIRRWWPGAGTIPWGAVRGQLRTVAVLGSALVLSSIYYRIDAALVLRLDGPAASGSYGVAYRILDQGRTVPSALLVPLGPLLAHAVRRAGGIGAGTDETLFRLGLAGGAGLGFGVIALADLIVRVVAGGDYADAGVLAVLLAVSLVLSGLVYTVTISAIMAGRERGYVAVAAAGVVFNVGANLLAIPAFGAKAAAVVTVATEVLVGLGLLVLGGQHAVRRYALGFGAALVAGTVAAAAKLAAMDAGLAANVAVSAALVAAALVLLRRAYGDLRRLPDPAPAA